MKKLFLLAFVLSIFAFSVDAKVSFLAGHASTPGRKVKSQSLSNEAFCKQNNYVKCAANKYPSGSRCRNTDYYQYCCNDTPNNYTTSRNDCDKQGGKVTDCCGYWCKCLIVNNIQPLVPVK